MNTPSLLGIGLYTFADVARLLNVPKPTLRRWAEGYTSASGSATLLPDGPQTGNGERLLTFADLIELKFVGMFRSEGLTLSTIRAAAQDAMRQFGSTHPFALQRLHTDGKRIFATLHQARSEEGATKSVLLELTRGQMVIEDVARPFFRQLEYDGEEVLRLRPLGPGTRVVLDPKRSFGKPIDERSGVPTFVLYQMARSGEPKERIAWWHNVDTDAISEAIEFESSLEKAA